MVSTRKHPHPHPVRCRLSSCVVYFPCPKVGVAPYGGGRDLGDLQDQGCPWIAKGKGLTQSGLFLAAQRGCGDEAPPGNAQEPTAARLGPCVWVSQAGGFCGLERFASYLHEQKQRAGLELLLGLGLSLQPGRCPWTPRPPQKLGGVVTCCPPPVVSEIGLGSPIRPHKSQHNGFPYINRAPHVPRAGRTTPLPILASHSAAPSRAFIRHRLVKRIVSMYCIFCTCLHF